MPDARRPVFIVTVDTEEEWDWHGDFPMPPFSTRNIQRIPVFQQLCESIGISPTYFVDYAVVDEPHNREILQHYFNKGECDIGAHLHPWCTPPVTEEIGEHNSHALNLDIELFRAKMITLTERLMDCFNTHPLSFRSGRWGLDGRLLSVLADLGYQVDSSVRPFFRDTCFSYNCAPTRPYRPSFNDILCEDSSQRRIIEIPVSSGFNHAPFEWLNRLHDVLSRPPYRRFRLIGLLWSLGLMRKIAITPEGHNAKDLCRCIDMCVKRGDGVINLFLHSSDLLPGSTDYVRDQTEEAAFYKTIEQCVEHARVAHDAVFLTMREAHEYFRYTV